MNIIPIIRDLLLRNQKATIPGFGTFMVIQKSAQLNKVTRVLSPPKTVISFIGDQKTDDGQLSGYLMQKLKQTKEDSLQAIHQFVREIENNLKEVKFSRLEGMGTLVLEKSGEISFTPEDELLKRLNLFDLPNLSIPKAPAEKVLQVEVTVPVESTRKRKWWIPVAVILLIVSGVGYLYYSGMFEKWITAWKPETTIRNTENEKLIFGQKNPSDTVHMDTVTQKISRELDERISRERALAYAEEKPKPAVKQPAVSPATNKPAITANKFHIIAGAFLVPNNAERFKMQLSQKGINAMLLPPQGHYYMVSLGSFLTNEEALRAKPDLEKKSKQVLWIKKIR